MVSRYRLPDEPTPGGLSRFAVDPMWPLLTLMLAGNGFGLIWFAFNSIALGSPSRVRDGLWIVTSLTGSLMLVLLLGLASQRGWLGQSQLLYASLSLIALKLTCGYLLYISQQRSCELWEYYGGQPANGMPVAILVSIFGRGILASEHLPPLLARILL